MIGHDGFERRAVPEIQRIDRLHIIVPVEQHMRPRFSVSLAIAFRNDRGMALGWPHLGFEAEAGDVLGQMIGGRLAILREGGIGRDRLDAEQRKQPLQAVVEIGIDAIENLLHLGVGHDRLSLRLLLL